MCLSFFKLGLEHLVGIKAKCSNFYDTRADLAFIRDYYHDDDTWSCYQGGNLEGWHTNEVKTQLMCVFWVDRVCTWWQKVAKHKRGQINMDPVAVFQHLPCDQWQQWHECCDLLQCPHSSATIFVYSQNFAVNCPQTKLVFHSSELCRVGHCFDTLSSLLVL